MGKTRQESAFIFIYYGNVTVSHVEQGRREQDLDEESVYFQSMPTPGLK